MSVLEQPLVCVDIETDGMNSQRGHILEIAAIRIEHGRITDMFTTLLNPGVEVPYFITNLTGITTHDLQGRPAFADIAERLQQIMDGAVFVAHNVRFDYSFIKQEFLRIGLPFNPKLLCTVKLSRALYPAERSHKLASLIERHGFTYASRHRAYDDAHVLTQFLAHVEQTFAADDIEQAVKNQFSLPSLPKALDRSAVHNLPTTFGVYIFKDENGMPIYIGKSVNIRRRVLSHFTRDTAEYKEFRMSQSVHGIDYQVTSGELSALLLESHLIKTKMPLYNRMLRRQRQFVVARKTRSPLGYDMLSYHQLSDIAPQDYEQIVAVYTTRAKAKASVITACRTFDLCPKLCGLEKSKGTCFSYQLKHCRGACGEREPAERYNERLASAFVGKAIDPWPYKTAVQVTESPDATTGFIVDAWRIIGTFVKNANGAITQSPYDAIFDLDAYKILRAFLTDPAKNLIVREIG